MRAQDAFDEHAPLPASALAVLSDLNLRDEEIDRLRLALTHAAEALSGCVCSMADPDLMDEIAFALNIED